MERLSPQVNRVKFSLNSDVSPEAEAFLLENGFVVFDRVFSADECSEILGDIEAAGQTLPDNHPDVTLGVDPSGARRPGRIYHAARHSPVVARLAEADQRLGAIASLCPGEKQLMIDYKSGVVFQDKWPDLGSGFKGLKWHDDFDAPEFGRTLTVGIYFDSSTQENGAMRVVPASHEWTREKPLPNDTDIHPDEMAIVASPGDVTAHLNGIWHCSPLGWTFGPEGRRRVLYFTFAERLPDRARSEAGSEYRDKVDIR